MRIKNKGVKEIRKKGKIKTIFLYTFSLLSNLNINGTGASAPDRRLQQMAYFCLV